MDRAFIGDSKIEGEAEILPERRRLLTVRRMTDREAVELIRWYNLIYKPNISEKVRCGGTINLIQGNLRSYYGE